MSAGEHWSGRYVGKPYLSSEFDCGDLARLVQREVFKREVRIPTERWSRGHEGHVRIREMAAQLQAMKADCAQPVEVPREGDAVLMWSGSLIAHVGVYFERGGEAWVLHAAERADQVIATRVRELEAKRFRLEGYYRWI